MLLESEEPLVVLYETIESVFSRLRVLALIRKLVIAILMLEQAWVDCTQDFASCRAVFVSASLQQFDLLLLLQIRLFSQNEVFQTIIYLRGLNLAFFGNFIHSRTDDVVFFREYVGMPEEEKRRYRQALEVMFGSRKDGDKK